MSWITNNLRTSLDTWNGKMNEWRVVQNINGTMQAIGLALLVLFFVVGVAKQFGNFAEVKKPEHAFKLFIRFVLAKGIVTYGMELMLAIFNIGQGIVQKIITTSGLSGANNSYLPQEIADAVDKVGFFNSIPLGAVTILGGLFITVLSFVMILTVYGRFFKLYLYTAIAEVL